MTNAYPFFLTNSASNAMSHSFINHCEVGFTGFLRQLRTFRHKIVLDKIVYTIRSKPSFWRFVVFSIERTTETLVHSAQFSSPFLLFIFCIYFLEIDDLGRVFVGNTYGTHYLISSEITGLNLSGGKETNLFP